MSNQISMSEIQRLEERLIDVIGMEFVELKSMMTSAAYGSHVEEELIVNCNVFSYHMNCWYALIFIFEFICMIFIYISFQQQKHMLDMIRNGSVDDSIKI